MAAEKEDWQKDGDAWNAGSHKPLQFVLLFISDTNFRSIFQGHPVDCSDYVTEDHKADGGVGEVCHIEVVVLVVRPLNHNCIEVVQCHCKVFKKRKMIKNVKEK